MFGERSPEDYKSAPQDARTGTAVSSDHAAVEDWLHRLARAIRQCHAYPIASAICAEAVASCHAALATLDGRERLLFRVTPCELIVDDSNVGMGSIIGQEVARRLHRANVASVTIRRTASRRELARFCGDVARCDTLAEPKTTIADLLLEHGVDSIVVEMAHRPEVLELGVPRAPRLQLVQSERRRRHAVTGPISHLYPPEKGWVRLDPSTRLGVVSLVDLAILVDDPAEIATMLLRLTDDESEGAHARDVALEQKLGDVATLFSTMAPPLARVMFAKLARAVLDLEPARRDVLLRRTILPGVLDGAPSGLVLRDFTDTDLADSLCLLLDFETAAPEVLATALHRLELPTSRQDSVVSLLEARLQARWGGRYEQATKSSADRNPRTIIRIESGEGRPLSELAAFDLSFDAAAVAMLASVRNVVTGQDVGLVELQCLRSLVKLEPSPLVARALLERARPLLADLYRTDRWSHLAAEIGQYRQIAEALAPGRPDVAEAVTGALTAFWTPERAGGVARLYGTSPDGRVAASRLIESSGPTMVSSLLALVDEPAADAIVGGVAGLLCDHARMLAPILVAALDSCRDRSARLLVRAIGFAGPGFETPVASQLGSRDEETDREVLSALVRIGTARAAAVVSEHLLKGSAGSRAAAEEALWHFPPDQTAAQLRDLLAQRDFVKHHPDVAVRLLDRAAQAKPAGLEPVLAGLTPFRFWFWNPGLLRVSRKARVLLVR